MFQKMLAWMGETLLKMRDRSSVVDELRVGNTVNQRMADALRTWSLMYVNQSPWLGEDVRSLNLPAAIPAEVARAVTIEMQVRISRSARADFLAGQMARVTGKLRQGTEYGAAKGGLMLKPYVSGESLAVDFVQADQFYPLAFDANGEMTACVFADVKTIGQANFTRLETHAMTGDGYQISNRAFRSTVWDALGHQVPLASVPVWAGLEEEAVIVHIARLLFAYFRMPFANNVDPSSPLGVSCYARAVDLIEQADRQWSELLWEFESAHRVLYTDPAAFQKDKNGLPILPNRRLYRTLDLNGKIDSPGLFEDWTPIIREVNLLNGLHAILKKIEFNCGMRWKGCCTRWTFGRRSAISLRAGNTAPCIRSMIRSWRAMIRSSRRMCRRLAWV